MNYILSLPNPNNLKVVQCTTEQLEGFSVNVSNVSFKMPSDRWDAFKAFCKESGVVPSEMIRMAVDQMLESKKLPIVKRSIEDYLSVGQLPPDYKNGFALLADLVHVLPKKTDPNEPDISDCIRRGRKRRDVELFNE